MKCVWDKVGCLTKSLARGENWPLFLKVCHQWNFLYDIDIYLDLICFLINPRLHLSCISLNGLFPSTWSLLLVLVGIRYTWFWLYRCRYSLINCVLGQLIAALVLVFTLFFVYEQYEEKIDAVAVIVYTIASKVSLLLGSKVSSRSNPLGWNRSLLDGRK